MRVLNSKKIEKDRLVNNLIPNHIIDFFNIKSITQKKDLSDVFEEATLLYADITDFTKYCSSRNPEEVNNYLLKFKLSQNANR